MPRITVTASEETAYLDYVDSTDLVHPGAVYSASQISLRSSQLSQGLEPYKSELANLKLRKPPAGINFTANRVYCDLAWVPSPMAEVGRGSSGSPNQGATDYMADMTASLVDAILFVWTGDRPRGSKAVDILNLWANKFTKILFDTTTWSDGKLLAGWSGSIMGRAVEILKSYYIPRSGEVVPNWTKIDSMMRNVVLPRATEWHNGSGGNWIASFVDATMQLGIALDDRSVFDLACARWRRVVPSLFYLPTDKQPATRPQLNGLPVVPPWTMWDVDTTTAATVRSIWGNPTSWLAGLEFELDRDFHHTAMSFAAVANAAESAWHQGVKLYDEEQARIIAACELVTRFIYDWWKAGATGTPAGWPYSTPPDGYATSTQRVTWTILYNHYNGRKGVSMPNTKRLLDEYVWPTTSLVIDLHSVAEELTHRNVG